MSPEERRQEKYAQLAVMAIFGAVVTAAVGGLFWAAGRDKDNTPSVEHSDRLKKEYKGTVFEEVFFDTHRSGR